MPTKAEIKQAARPAKLKIRKGDKVKIISGKDRGQEGFVAVIDPKKQFVMVLQDNPENPDQPIPLNAAIKHRKAKRQGEKSVRLRIPVKLHISKVMVIDPTNGEPSRIGRRKEGGKLVRYAKRSGKSIVDAPLIDKD